MTVPLDTVNDIRSMDAAGRSRSEIARMLHVSRNTVAKYADMEDMSPAAPMPRRRGRPALEGNEEWVAGVLEADLGAPRKQRHTARRIYDRLVAERGYGGSYSTVQRFVRELRLARAAAGGEGYLELEWAPGTCQVDFGQDAHGVGPLRAGVREEARGALLHGVLARDAPEARPRRREARPGGRNHRQGPPARHRRARVSPARRGRGEAALPGPRRRIREAVGGIHHEPGVQQVWAVFGDDQMAAALIDRIVHHGRLVQFRGESYRVRHALMQEG